MLDPIELRILGSLLEKEQATPEYYPLTLNALSAACNQKSNREPVTSFSETEIQPALGRLQEDKLVWQIVGGRATRWQHNLDAAWALSPASKAVITLLLLRGPQTSGELRARSDRLFDFATLEEVEATLRAMAAALEPLVRELPRRPGQKESRWAHLFGAEVSGDDPGDDVAQGAAPARGESINSRMDRLEASVAELRSELESLKTLLGA